MKNPKFTTYNDYPYEYIVNRAVEKGLITPKDQELIIAYIVDKISKGLIEDARAQRISTYLTQWRRFIDVPYDKMTYDELLKGVAMIRKGNSMFGKPYSPDTIRGHIKAIKAFTKFLNRRGIISISRDDLDEIKYPKEITDSIKSQDLLTDEKTEQLIGVVKKLRNKAIIGTLKDTGLRPVDLTGIKWRDMEFNQRRVKITVIAEKTNAKITCYVILHKGWLVELRKLYNNAGDDDYVFVDDGGEPLSYKAVDKMLKRAAAKTRVLPQNCPTCGTPLVRRNNELSCKCGFIINENDVGVKFPRGATAKLFRATSITDKQRKHYSNVAVSMLHFGTPDSNMIQHYSKFNDEDTERESLEISGASPPEPIDILRPSLCPQCSEPISPGMKFCPECSFPLTNKVKAELDDEMKFYEKQFFNPDFMKNFMAAQEKYRREHPDEFKEAQSG